MPKTNRELAEEIEANLSTLIERGNVDLIPAHAQIDEFLHQIKNLEQIITAIRWDEVPTLPCEQEGDK